MCRASLGSKNRKYLDPFGLPDPLGLYEDLPVDDSAEIARRKEEERLRKIAEGKERVNDIFSGFDDSFYKNIESGHLDYYMPQLDEQFGRAKSKTTAGLYRSGNIQGSAGANTLADLFADYNQRAQGIASEALDARGRAKSDVERNRADLIAQLEGGAGVDTIAQSANARAASISRPQPYSPMADMFSQWTSMYANDRNMQGQGYPGMYGSGRRSSGSSNRNSVTTVGG